MMEGSRVKQYSCGRLLKYFTSLRRQKLTKVPSTRWVVVVLPE